MSHPTFRIGVDFGGVLSQHDPHLITESHVNTAINMPGAMEQLSALKEDGHTLYLISFCGRKRAIESKTSLETEFLPNGQPLASLFERMYFVRDRAYKKTLCEYLNCHFMIDDRQDTLEHVSTSACQTIPILFGKSEVEPSLDDSPSRILPAMNWLACSAIIRSTAAFSADLERPEPTKLFFSM